MRDEAGLRALEQRAREQARARDEREQEQEVDPATPRGSREVCSGGNA